MEFKVVERVRLWLGWCPQVQERGGIMDFSVKSQSNTVYKEGSPKPVSAVELDSLRWMDVYHNRVLVLTGGLSALFLSLFSMLASSFSMGDVLELFLIGFLVGTLFMLVSSYRVIRKLNKEGKIEQLKTRKDYMFFGVAIFLSIYLGVWIIFPVMVATYGNGAQTIAVTGFVLPMWFWLLSIMHWEKKNNELLVIKRVGLFGSSIEPVDRGDQR